MANIFPDIEDTQIHDLIIYYESRGCSVEVVKQENGKWTLTADCPEGV